MEARRRVILEPPEGAPPDPIRQHRSGRTAVMQGEWRDPDDIRPNASRYARSVKGYRAYDPLRWSRARHGERSQFTEEHVVAADRLRRAVDLARLGGLPLPWAGNLRIEDYGPRSGPTASALAMIRAEREVNRVWRMFGVISRQQIAFVLLHNGSVTAWVKYRSFDAKTTYKHEMQRLIDILNRLVEHFDSEIREEIQKGAVI